MARRESEQEKEQRERAEMMARIEEDIIRRRAAINADTTERLKNIDETFEQVERDVKAKKEKKKAEDTLGTSNQTPTELENKLNLENMKVAKGFGWWGWLTGGNDSSDDESPTQEEKTIRAKTSASEKNTIPSIVSTDTGLGDDGYMYYFYTYSDGSVEQKRM